MKTLNQFIEAAAEQVKDCPQGQYYCNKDKEQWPKSNQKLKSLFYIQNDVWQDLIIDNYTDFIDMLI